MRLILLALTGLALAGCVVEPLQPSGVHYRYHHERY
jgi:hypothetical protein